MKNFEQGMSNFEGGGTQAIATKSHRKPPEPARAGGLHFLPYRSLANNEFAGFCAFWRLFVAM
jgi:hypothetical protein